jgi:hypothetical protein
MLSYSIALYRWVHTVDRSCQYHLRYVKMRHLEATSFVTHPSHVPRGLQFVETNLKSWLSGAVRLLFVFCCDVLELRSNQTKQRT